MHTLGTARNEVGSSDLLWLVRKALSEIDDRPVDVTARRVARIASLLGESELAVYLGFELAPTGGLPATNAENARNLMSNPEVWNSSDGPHEAALAKYLGNRQAGLPADQRLASLRS